MSEKARKEGRRLSKNQRLSEHFSIRCCPPFTFLNSTREIVDRKYSICKSGCFCSARGSARPPGSVMLRAPHLPDVVTSAPWGGRAGGSGSPPPSPPGWRCGRTVPEGAFRPPDSSALALGQPRPVSNFFCPRPRPSTSRRARSPPRPKVQPAAPPAVVRAPAKPRSPPRPERQPRPRPERRPPAKQRTPPKPAPPPRRSPPKGPGAGRGGFPGRGFRLW